MNRRQFLTFAVSLASGMLTGSHLASAQTLVRRRIECPILMYHYISTPPETADRYRFDLSLPPDRFEEHCAFLVDNGYTGISLWQLHQALTEGTPLPDKPVILTFDDGYIDAFENAFPILQAHDLVATFFIVTQFMDNPGYMTWGQASRLIEAGMEVENHSRSHPNLAERERDFLMREIDGAANAIEATFGYRPRFFCYPAGRFDENTIEIVRETGHLMATTTWDGMLHYSSDLFRLRRLRIRNSTGINGLQWLMSPRASE